MIRFHTIPNVGAPYVPISNPPKQSPFRRLKIKAKKVAAPLTYFDYISIANEERMKMLMMRSEGYSRIIAELNNKTERLTKLSEDISRLQAKLGE